MGVRTYKWKRQIRESKDQPWRDAPENGCPDKVEVPDYRRGKNVKKPNSFRLGDKQEIPDEILGIPSTGSNFEHDVRIVLESIDGEVVRLIREYPRVDPDKKIILENGYTIAICKFEDCGAELPIGQATNHLREVHGIRLRLARKIDHTHKKYFDIKMRH